ncbi:unnamed protein product [Protopolystoma xenopodis]|uniref:Uncharacterized protein n=1 Tax=Protopolystoma xenopodis TaxID=117903 RepID=A0A3S5BBR7_9PLAT|nr:unnamed protein product [Protopolystoma xenopodis]
MLQRSRLREIRFSSFLPSGHEIDIKRSIYTRSWLNSAVRENEAVVMCTRRPPCPFGDGPSCCVAGGGVRQGSNAWP